MVGTTNKHFKHMRQKQPVTNGGGGPWSVAGGKTSSTAGVPDLDIASSISTSVIPTDNIIPSSARNGKNLTKTVYDQVL